MGRAPRGQAQQASVERALWRFGIAATRGPLCRSGCDGFLRRQRLSPEASLVVPTHAGIPASVAWRTRGLLSEAGSPAMPWPSGRPGRVGQMQGQGPCGRSAGLVRLDRAEGHSYYPWRSQGGVQVPTGGALLKERQPASPVRRWTGQNR